MNQSNNNDQTFLVTGASSGLGKAVAENLIMQNHNVVLIARNKDSLMNIKKINPKKTTIIPGDLTSATFIEGIKNKIPKNLAGAFINAGGPMAGTFEDISIKDWDNAYNLVIRWKILMTKAIMPIFKQNKYGRFLFSESTSITRPVQNLVLSNSLRMAIHGLIKTLVYEHRNSGITFNIIAPGFHETAAVERLYKKISEQENIPIDKAKEKLKSTIPTGETGIIENYASLANWLLGKQASYVNGQIFNIDGGVSV